jgi:DNA-binding NtrC family response regulator
MKDQATVLFVDDEESMLQTLKRVFLDDGYRILTAASPSDALEVLEQEPVHVVVSDHRMPGMTGLEFLGKVARARPDTVRIILSGQADMTAVVDAINAGGIYKFMLKPWNEEELRVTIANAVTLYFLQKKVVDLAKEVNRKDEEIARLRAELKGRS